MGAYTENEPEDASSLNSAPVRENLTALFEGDFQPLRVRAQTTPDMTLQVEDDNDRAYVSGNIPIDFTGGNSPSFTAPANANEKRIDLLTLNISGYLEILPGTSTTGTPSPPDYPSDKMVLAEIYQRYGMSGIKNIDDGTNGYIFKIRSPLFNLGGGTPVGAIMPYGGSTAPTGFLLCDGTTGLDSTSDTSLATLYAVIGTTFGGTGASDFDLPDMRGNFPLGKDNMGGSSRNRVTSGSADSIGGQNGSENHTLTTAQIPAHTHTYTYKTSGVSGGSSGSVWSGASSQSTGSAGSGNAHNNMPPYMALNYIMKK